MANTCILLFISGRICVINSRRFRVPSGDYSWHRSVVWRMVGKEFRCQKCLRYKKPELLSRYENSKQGKRAICTSCDARILEAANKREALTG